MADSLEKGDRDLIFSPGLGATTDKMLGGLCAITTSEKEIDELHRAFTPVAIFHCYVTNFSVK